MAQLDDERFDPNCQDHSEGLNSLHCGHSNQSCSLGSHLDQSGIPNCPQDKPKLVLENAGPRDVAFEASKSCTQFLASNCEHHPQNESQIFHNNQLVEASAELQEIICSIHRQVKEVFCLSDQQCICHLCVNDEHQGHETVLAAEHRTKMQKDLGIMRYEIQQKILDRKKCAKHLQKIWELERKLQQEISDLRRKDTELEKLSHIKEDSQFLLRYSALSEPTHSADTLHHLSCLQEVRAAVLELTEKPQSQDHTLPSVTEKMVEEATHNPPANFMRSSPGGKKSKLLQLPESRVKGRIQSSSSPTSWFRSSPTVRIYPVVSGQTFGAAESILVQVKNQKSTEVQTGSLQDCDIIMVFCPITSRIGSDVEGALGREEVSLSNKPIILVLMHHTRKVDYSSGRRNWAENYPKVKLEVHILFHETQQGLLQCERNNQAVIEIQKELHKHSKSNWNLWSLSGF